MFSEILFLLLLGQGAVQGGNGPPYLPGLKCVYISDTRRNVSEMCRHFYKVI